MTSKMSRSVGPFSILGWLWKRSIHFPDVMKDRWKKHVYCHFLELLIRCRWNCAQLFQKDTHWTSHTQRHDFMIQFTVFDMFVHVVHLCVLQSICFHYLLLYNRFWTPIKPTPILVMCQKESSYPKPSKVQLILREALRWTVFGCDDHENHHLWSWIITLASFIICIVIIILMNIIIYYHGMIRVWNHVYHS